MPLGYIACSYCKKDFLKDKRHINENLKLGNNCYCSSKCQYLFKNKQIELECENSACVNKFKRAPNDISLHNYCSRSCAVAINNAKFPKRAAIIRKCKYCEERMFKYRIYCSVKCKAKDKTISEKEIIEQIVDFFIKYRRIPLKREFHHYSAARKRFGNWNNAIISAGFKPNPVLFAEHQIANDGHSCDSIAEKLIDDYLHEKGILHERNIPYPEGEYSADFKIDDKWVEYFGLTGEHKRYDELRAIKQKLVRKYKISLIEIYPKDLYPHNKLAIILGS